MGYVPINRVVVQQDAARGGIGVALLPWCRAWKDLEHHALVRVASYVISCAGLQRSHRWS